MGHGNLAVLEGTPGLRVSDPVQLRGLSTVGFGCRGERWERSQSGTDADLEVMWGRSALLYVLRMRSHGSTASEVPGVSKTRVPVYRFASASEEGLVFDLRPDTVLAVSTAPGAMPSASAVQTWLLQ